VARLDLDGRADSKFKTVAGNVGALSPVSTLACLNLTGTNVTGWPLAITDGCCIFTDAAHPYCVGKPGADAACVTFVQTTALLAFKASGGAATALALASWRSGTDPCGGAWEGVTCSSGAAPAVTTLNLGVNDGPSRFKTVAGNVGALAPLAQLTYLSLGDTKVAGDVQGMAPLGQLSYLDLGWTEVAGDIKGLAPLVQLMTAGLQNTKVAGDVIGLAPLVQLVALCIDHTEVVGQAAALAPLVHLNYLRLADTAVVGCGAFCAANGSFHTHCDPHPDPLVGCSCRC
jgi:hypothetical protein